MLEVKNQLFKPLLRRPAAITVTVRELLTKALAGEIRIPNFQRPLRWRSENVVDLLDSIWRGYPVGSLLFWKRPAPQDSIRIGNAHHQVPDVADAWWVVDGQQRATALAASLTELDQAGDSRWLAHYNPETEQFNSGLPSPDRLLIDVPLSQLGDLRRLGRWLRNCALTEKQMNHVEEVQQRLLDYALPAYVVETDDEQALRGVFARLNSTGARMRADEVFQALLGAPSSHSSVSLDLDQLQAACDLNGFGLPPRSEILKAILAMSGLDPSRRLEQLGARTSLELVNPDEARESLTRTVDFLRSYCDVPHVSLIPYPVVFYILARWFFIHPDSEPATLRVLSQWLWQGAHNGSHQRAEVSRMREQVRDIQSGDDQRSLDRLLSRLSRGVPPRWQLRRFNLKSANSRIETLALLSQGPRDKLGPISPEELTSSGRVAREIVPSSKWNLLSDESKILATSAANRVLLHDVHTGLRSAICDWRWPEDEDILESHLISESQLESLKVNDFDQFLHLRAESVIQAVEAFLNKRLGLNRPLIRPARYYQDLSDE